MPSNVGYLLDTNVLLALVRGKTLGVVIDSRFGLRSTINRSMICVVTAGEMLSLAHQFAWGQSKRDDLQAILDEIVCIDINHPDIIDAYAEIDFASRSHGRKMGKSSYLTTYCLKGGAGETVRRNLMKQCDVHTLLRLPTGIFYAGGVKANVLFLDAKPAQEKPWTKTLWVYDLRTSIHFTQKTNPLQRSDLDEFVSLYRPGKRHLRKPTWSDENPEGRWRSYDYDELIKRDKVNLDIFWLRDQSLEDSDDLPAPDILAQEIADDLQAALEQFTAIAEKLR